MTDQGTEGHKQLSHVEMRCLPSMLRNKSVIVGTTGRNETVIGGRCKEITKKLSTNRKEKIQKKNIPCSF